MLKELDVSDWLEMNGRLQKKKNHLRKMLKDKGVLKRDGSNAFDKYKYFSEAQYKLLFTELFSESGLELKFTEVGYETFDGTEKQHNGRFVKLMFTLTDTDTGFYEETVITGEGLDKGDKAGYKAYTGAMKYYLANTFLVATGDDPEKESPDEKTEKPKHRTERKATQKQVQVLSRMVEPALMLAALEPYGVTRFEDLTIEQASDMIGEMRR